MAQTESVKELFNTVRQWENFVTKFIKTINEGTPDDVFCNKGLCYTSEERKDILCAVKIKTNIKSKEGYKFPNVSIHITNSQKAAICGTKTDDQEEFLSCDITKYDEIIATLLEQKEKTGTTKTLAPHLKQSNKTQL